MPSLKKLMNSHKTWAEQRSSQIEADSLKMLEEIMPNLAAERMMVGFTLDALALVEGTRGLVEVESGAPSGWEKLARSMALRAWAYTIVLDGRSVQLTNFLSQIACLGCCCSAWRDVVLRGFKRALEPRALDPGYWESRIFEPFVLSVLEHGKPTNARGVYGKVAAAWDDPDGLVSALHEVCDYHMKNTTDRRDWDAEFRFAPFDLLPVEVMLVRRTKAAEGVVLPPVRHELIDLLKAPPDLPAAQPTPLLNWIEGAYARGY